jgi:hypothetical protein
VEQHASTIFRVDMTLNTLKMAACSSKTPEKPYTKLHHINPEDHNLNSDHFTAQEKTTINWKELKVQIWVT